VKAVSALAIALVVGFFIAAMAGLLVAYPVKWLWNYAAVDIFSLRPLDFWHAWALSWLSSLLVKTSVTTK
jgi:hypothetical protein